MKVTMAELNKRANSIINEVAKTGETAVVYKHGTPIAEIKPHREASVSEQALDYFSQIEPIDVETKLQDVLAQARQRGV